MVDVNLIQQCKEGDRDAFARLVSHYQSLVHACCFHFTRNVSDAEDLVQETFLRVYLDLHQLQDHTKFPMWLRQVTNRVCRMWKRRHRQTEHADVDSAMAPEVVISHDASPEHELIRRDIRELIVQSIARLPEDQRMMVTMYYLDDWSYREIADVLDLPQTTIKTRLHRARRRLKRDLLQRFATETGHMVQCGVVNRLPDPYRLFARFSYQTGLSPSEMAYWLNMPLPMVWYRLFEMRRQLQQRLLDMVEEAIVQERLTSPGVERIEWYAEQPDASSGPSFDRACAPSICEMSPFIKCNVRI